MEYKIHFTCSDRRLVPDETWDGWIEPLSSLGNAVTELKIQSRSGLYAIVGNTCFGHFICLPDWGVGTLLSDFTDLFFNKERLVELLGPVDGITVACALKAAHKYCLI